MKTNKLVAELAKRTVQKTLYQNAKSTTCGAFYQPKVPTKLYSYKDKK